MMGDVGEMFEGMREESQAKRAINRDKSQQILIDNGIPFKYFNFGAHLVVDSRFDFWPGTGKFTCRETSKSGRGIFNLLKKLKPKPKVQQGRAMIVLKQGYVKIYKGECTISGFELDPEGGPENPAFRISVLRKARAALDTRIARLERE